MNLDQLIGRLRTDRAFMDCVTEWRTLPATEGRYEPLPDDMDPRLCDVLRARGIHRLYCHQAECFRLAQEGRDFVVVTPTASGKTLCYNLPVVSAILKNNDARALYLFPTKALSADQVSGLYDMIEALGVDIKTYTYDGDTQAAARKAIREAGHIVVTNPDMLHANILPHHTRWVKLFENLEYIVIDELHTYRGVFGSHLANVLRRLMRLCAFYGSHPRFILCSATIANPVELASQLTGRVVKYEMRRAQGRAAFRILQPARGQPPAGHPPRRGQRGPAHRRRAFKERHSHHRVLQKPDSGGGHHPAPQGMRPYRLRLFRPCAGLPRRLSALRAS